MKDKYFLLWIVVACICGLFVGVFIGIIMTSMSELNIAEEYSEVARQTCEYANHLTELVNMQGETLSMVTGTNHTNLNKLDCRLLLWDQQMQ